MNLIFFSFFFLIILFNQILVNVTDCYFKKIKQNFGVDVMELTNCCIQNVFCFVYFARVSFNGGKTHAIHMEIKFF